ncbi:MAG TPA: hypothetical protein VEY69_03300, partial [Lautropia sp.]|nr:hypothetical protein [Lautropia sp.]
MPGDRLAGGSPGAENVRPFPQDHLQSRPSELKDWLDRLNGAQRQAVTFGSPGPGGIVQAPPLLVIAGA